MDILHLIGLCPDSVNHLDVIDIITSTYFDISYYFNYIKNIIKNGK